MLKFLSFLFPLFCLTCLPSLVSAQTPPVKIIVFDFGGVIAKGDKQEIGNYIAKTFDISPEEGLKSQTELKQYLTQGGSEQDFWKMYAQSKGKSLPDQWIEKLDQVRLRAIKEIPGMVNVVKTLQKQGYQTALLSNVRMSQAKLKRQLGYYSLFDPVLLSYEIGVDKPNAKAYQILLDTLGAPPERVLFIDNKPQNIEAAKSMGIDAILFQNADQLIREFRQRGIIISQDNQEATSPAASAQIKNP
ncbi:HAD family hydrolase [Candidatus Protochlamydia phocaeensis]|uniref:HAD family hydrolase n=1 Tax=Candidatus Protochlamydia phocaeensis TaxID=1414722 RepID=UPI000838BD1B|nr:HAD family phosphatase [Candidatus Protochlamydia phocaeensis]